MGATICSSLVEVEYPCGRSTVKPVRKWPTPTVNVSVRYNWLFTRSFDWTTPMPLSAKAEAPENARRKSARKTAPRGTDVAGFRF